MSANQTKEENEKLDDDSAAHRVHVANPTNVLGCYRSLLTDRQRRNKNSLIDFP